MSKYESEKEKADKCDAISEKVSELEEKIREYVKESELWLSKEKEWFKEKSGLNGEISIKGKWMKKRE